MSEEKDLISRSLTEAEKDEIPRYGTNLEITH